MNKTCDIERATSSISGRGVASVEWTDNATSIKCALIVLSAQEQFAAKGWGIDADYKILLPSGTDVRPEPSDSSSGALPDRIEIASVKYLVKRMTDVSGRGKTLVVWVKAQN